MEDKTGGPAFPQPLGADASKDPLCSGMTLRDYFAGKALIALLNHREYKLTHNGLDLYAKDAYAQADAMLEARKSNIAPIRQGG